MKKRGHNINDEYAKIALEISENAVKAEKKRKILSHLYENRFNYISVIIGLAGIILTALTLSNE